MVGHIGFPESIHLIAAAIGWDIERIEETREAIISEVRRETPCAVVRPGAVAGCLHRAEAYREGRPVITLIHPQQVHLQLAGTETGDRIEIRGTPTVRFSSSPEIPGGEGTCALEVNRIPRILNARSAHHGRSAVPAALLGDVRRFVHSLKRDKQDSTRAGRACLLGPLGGTQSRPATGLPCEATTACGVETRKVLK